jgi:putative alpha-1,2-mannosidase
MGGKAYEKNYIKHGDLLKGATLDYVMDDKPNKKRGTSADAAPYSFTKELKGIK